MIEFEYHIEKASSFNKTKLNELGKQRWKLISMLHDEFIFIREKEHVDSREDSNK